MSKNKNKKNKSLFAASVVVLCILIIFLMFLVKREQIVSNLKETGFFDKVFGKTPEFIENHTPTARDNGEKIELKSDEEVVIHVTPDKDDEIELKTVETNNNDESVKSKISENTKTTENTSVTKENTKTETPKETEKTTDKKINAMTDVQLCFVEIDAEGSVVRKIVKRSVPKTDSPLTNAISQLLKGPDTTKATEKNCMTLIPKGTKLLSAKVSSGVAYLNFNEAFSFNEVGVEGYIGQLMQIVYTATAFSTVNSVQFLIEGQKTDYLGSEGQWIGSPLSKNSF